MRKICSLLACMCLMGSPVFAQPTRNDGLQPGQVDLQLAGEIELGILIDIISERLGVNIVSSSEHDKKKVLIRSNEPIPEASLLSLLEISMRSHDLILAPSTDPHWYTIVDSKDLLAAASDNEDAKPERPQLPNARKPFREQLEQRPRPRTVELRILRPKHISVDRAQEVVKNFLTKQGSTTLAIEEDGALIIADFSDRVERAAAMLEIADKPMHRAAVRFVPIEHATPKQIADQAKPIINAQSRSSGGQGSGRESPVEILIDDRSSQLVVVGPETEVLAAIEILESLDAPIPIERQPIQFYRLENAKAEDVLATITLLEADGSINALLFDPTHAQDAPEVESVEASASNNEQTVEVAKPRVAIDVPSNTIIVIGDQVAQSIYGRLIHQLDQRRPQVMIEITVVVIDSSDSFRIGVDIGGNFGGNPNSVTFSSFGFSDVDPATGNLTINPGLGFNAAILSPDFADIVVQALQTDSRARVMSAPRLLVNDNATGSLTNTAQEPYESFNSFDTGSSSSTFGGFVDAGTTFEVTPRISNGDHLAVEYKIELSSFGDRSIADLPPPRNQNSLASEITIPDGHTIVSGGIRTSNESVSRDGVPILGDIPLLGQLFRNDRESSGESTIFVFIKPTILRNERFEDLKLLSQPDIEEAELQSGAPPSRMIFTGRFADDE